MALLTPAVVGPNGTGKITDIDAAGAAAAGGGDTFAHSGKETVFISNGGGSPITVTMVSQPDNFGTTVAASHDVTLAVPAGKIGVIGPAESAKFRDPATGLVSLTYSAVTSVKVKVLTFAVTA